MLSRLLCMCSLMFLFSCQDNLVTIKNDKGVIVENYQILPDSTKNGLYTAYFDNGKTRETATYENGTLVGERIIYFPNGNPEIRENYVDGQLAGTYYSYYENGQVEISAPYSDGNMNGSLTAYYENGKVKEVVTIVDGNENGPFKEYYENGQIHWEGNYLNGDNEFGLLKEYDENGKLLKKMMCDSLAICRTIWTPQDGDIVPTSI